MKRLFAMLRTVRLSTAALADEAPKPAAAPKKAGKAPLVVSFTDRQWTELP